MLTPIRLRQAALLAQHGSFRRAATVLKVSQPALTKGIQALEAELGVRLFDRQARSVTPTTFGRRLLEHVDSLQASEADLLRDLALMRGLEAGSVQIALGPYPSVVSGYAAAAKLVAAHPKLEVAMRVSNWREVTRLVAERRADIGVAELSDALLNDALETEEIGRHHARVFCRSGHPLLTRKRLELADLFQYPWVHTRIPPRIAAAFPRAPLRAGHIDEITGDFVPAVELDVPMLLGGFMKASDSLVWATLGLMERELEACAVAVLPIDGPAFRGSYGFIRLRNRSHSPGTLAYMDALREVEAQVIERETRLKKIYG